MKKLLAIGAVMALVGVMAAPMAALAASASGSTTGNVTVGSAAPSIATPTLGAGLVPGTTVALTVPVTDVNGLADIKEVWVVLAFDGGDLEQKLDAKNAGNTVVDTLVIVKWAPSAFSVVGQGTGTHWNVAGTAPSSGTTGNFVFNITIGDVARYAQGAAGQDGWDIYIRVTDLADQVAENGPGAGTSSLVDLAMGAYASINVTPTPVSFGNLNLGESHSALSGGYFTTTCVANTVYDLKIQSTDWSGSGHTLVLDEDGAPGADSFSIEADDDSTLDNPADSKWVTKTPTTITGHSADPRSTAEAGNSVTIYMWVSLGPSAFSTTYSGAITMTAVY